MKAGWCLALAYLFCVLAPSLSFAFAAEGKAAPCIIENHGPGMDMGNAVRHLHQGGAVHDHSHHASAARDQATYHNYAGGTNDPHKGADNRCCNLVFASVIPAPEITYSTPVAPCSRCVTERAGAIPDNTPPARYRPPIS